MSFIDTHRHIKIIMIRRLNYLPIFKPMFSFCTTKILDEVDQRMNKLNE